MKAFSRTAPLAGALVGMVSVISAAPVRAGDSSGDTLETIVVTAQKRNESALDVPMSLTALGENQLAGASAYRFEDYAGKVPGLTLIDLGAAGSQLVIRGISSGTYSIGSSVATYIDETPFTPQGPFTASFLAAPNLDTFDMQRVEVLRGPQGTLYGANALGGLLKYVSNSPDPTGFAAKAATGVSSVDGGGTGFDAHGMVNLPLSSTLALRVVGYDDYYPGFIDDPSRGLKDINGSHSSGGRAALLFQPEQGLSIRLNALYQNRSWSDWGNEDVNSVTLTPLYGNLVQKHLVGQPGETTTQLYNLTVNWDSEFVKLVSASSYYESRINYATDMSSLYGPIVSAGFGTPYGVVETSHFPVQAFTQELRLSSAGNQPLQWLMGGYFTNEQGHENEGLFPIDVNTRSILTGFPVNLGDFDIPTHYREYAGFASLDYKFTPTIDTELGGRYSHNDQRFHETALGLFGGAANFDNVSSESVFTYSADSRWHVTPDSMLYARIASGFQPGGPTGNPSQELAKAYLSSTTTNYEIGLKSSLLGHHLIAEVSTYYIDWRRIQLLAIAANGLSEIVNGGAAHSKGVEWSFTYLPARGLTLGLNGSYDDARLVNATPPNVNGSPGDRLPYVPSWQTSVDARYEHPLFGAWVGFVAADWRFTATRLGEFSAAGPRQELPEFNIVDLQVGANTGKWSLTAYVKNVGNKIAFSQMQEETLAGGLGPQSATVYTPRTVGLEAAVSF